MVEPIMTQFSKPVEGELRGVLRVTREKTMKILELKTMTGIVSIAEMSAATMQEAPIEL